MERSTGARREDGREPAPLAPAWRQVLGRLRLARRQAWKDVTLWPLVLPGAEAPGDELWPLEEALDDGFVAIAHPPPRWVAPRSQPSPPDPSRPEPSGSAASGWVHVESRAAKPVWIACGEPVGAAGRAARTRILAPHGSTWVPLGDSAAQACPRCVRELAAGFHVVEDQVGFVASVHDRALALEGVLPVGLLARRLRRRIAAWGPFLCARAAGAWEAQEGAGEEAGEPGFDSPEALLAAVLAAPPGGPDGELAGARVSLVAPRGSPEVVPSGGLCGRA